MIQGISIFLFSNHKGQKHNSGFDVGTEKNINEKTGGRRPEFS